MPLTVQQLVDLAATPPVPGRRGTITHHLRQLDREEGPGRPANSAPVRAFLAALLDEPVPPAAPTGHAHPALGVRATARPPGAEPYTLSAADVVWLQRLPEPDAVTHADAVHLARLAVQVQPGSGDERLLTSIWAPVKARHDRAAAENALAAAQTPLPDMPARLAENALAEALRRETSELTDREIRTRAAELVQTAGQARGSHRETAIAAAENALATIAAAQADREALTA